MSIDNKTVRKVSKLAKINPSAVICEVMNEDGRMARLKDLRYFSKKHKLKITSIENLISFRLENEKLIKNSEKEIKNLIKICNLKWDDNCLKFYENNKTYIKTTSAVQARMPIYSKSIGNYSNFKEYVKFT